MAPVQAISIASVITVALSASIPTGDYRARIEHWRAQHQKELAADDGWLTVAGLDWLKEGENRIGATPSSDVPLPPHSAPTRVATIIFHAGQAVLHPAPGVHLLLNGKPATVQSLHEDTDILAINRLKFYLIRRGDKVGVRLKDNDNPERKHFTGLNWYPVDASWRIQAKYTAWKTPHSIVHYNTIGQRETDASPGFVTFTRNGREYRLEPMLDDGELFFVFRDRTSGKTTYGASRFLYTEPPHDPTKDGFVWLDFNKAENPPCAFTAYATCPLPPPQNRLDLAVNAGEKIYHGGAHASKAAAARR
ncbi:MAG TPA: DUF1684 domain-containing protein [Bryobacteraceae bacterium]|nr:DUF1684 domain-containing protein [Bryobacteraceae bacterium]